MRSRRKRIAALGLVCTTSCAGADVGLLDVTTGEMQHPPYGDMRQTVVSVDPEHGHFTTLVREGNALSLRTFDRACGEVGEAQVPLFTESCCSKDQYAVSSDLKRIAYLRYGPPDLMLLEVSTGKERVLLTNFASPILGMSFLTWLDDRRLLAVVGDFAEAQRYVPEVIVIDVESGRRTTVYNPRNTFSHEYALHPAGTLLAFDDDARAYGFGYVIKIISLETGELVGQLGSGEGLIGNPCWTPDGRELAYVEGEDLKLWNYEEDASRTLATFPKDFTCYDIVACSGLVGYGGSTSFSSKRPLVLLDSMTGREVRRVTAQYNGSIVRLDAKTLVCELGF